METTRILHDKYVPELDWCLIKPMEQQMSPKEIRQSYSSQSVPDHFFLTIPLPLSLSLSRARARAQSFLGTPPRPGQEEIDGLQRLLEEKQAKGIHRGT